MTSNIKTALKFVPVCAIALAMVACGTTTEQRAATGAGAGAVVAGPVGAVAGAAVGTAVSKAKGE